MLRFETVMERLKYILMQERGTGRIKDKELAAALGLEASYFAVIKKRGKIPYEAIAHFCKARQVSINWVLFSQEPLKLIA